MTTTAAETAYNDAERAFSEAANHLHDTTRDLVTEVVRAVFPDAARLRIACDDGLWSVSAVIDHDDTVHDVDTWDSDSPLYDLQHIVSQDPELDEYDGIFDLVAP